MVRREQSLFERPPSFSAGLRRFLPNPQSYGKIWCAWHANDDIKEISFLISFTGISVSLVLLHHSLDLVSQFRRLRISIVRQGLPLMFYKFKSHLRLYF